MKPNSLLPDKSEMSQRVHSFDWSKTPLGPIDSWSPTLRMMTSFLLANRFPLLLWWGPQFIQIYNDAYIPVLGAKHPDPGLGRPLRECWSEIWEILRPLVEIPFNGGPATWMEDIFLEINRHGFLEETHFTIAYSPVPDSTTESGIGGVLATVHEITEKVVNERRIALLRDLGVNSSEAKTVEEACENAATALHNSKDIPFALFYLLDADRQTARLAATAGMAKGTNASPVTILLDSKTQPDHWPVTNALEGEQIYLVHDLSKKFADIPIGPWPEPPNSAAIIPIRSNVQRQPAGFIIAGISPRKRYDQNYAAFLHLISTQVATAVASARAYDEERKRAEALADLDQAKTTFFNNVSHELRTPLTLMLGPIEEELREHPETRPRLEVAHRNSLRLLKLVNTLLDFSRIEAGRVQTHFEPTDLAAFTSELASGFRTAMENAGLRFIVNCPPLPEPVFVDCEMWEKVVLNLLSNAFKFTLSGSVTVNLGLRSETAELTVSDTGTGIPAAELPRIFDRFYRARSAQARTYEGTGIGLALVRELIKILGGEIRVTSVEGKGSVFTVNLPIKTSSSSNRHGQNVEVIKPVPTTSAALHLQEVKSWLPQPGAVSIKSPPALGNTSPAIKPAQTVHILVAEDNADMRQYITRLLGDYYTVSAVPDGRVALDAIQAQRPDLILSDIMMPNLDGLELLRELRSHPDTATLPIILLSARAGEEARIEGISNQANDYLIKPFSARELLARVSTHLELARVRNEAETALLDRENRFRALVQASSDIVYCMSADWKEMRLLVGKDFVPDTYEPNQNWLQKYVHPDDQNQVVSVIEQAVRMKSPFELEHRVIQKDGTPGWIFSRAIPLLDAEGQITEWFGAASDISERKNSERKMAQLLESETMARREAEEGTRAKNRFLAALSHELRTPLNPVLLIASDCAENRTLPSEIRADFEIIRKNVEIEIRLIDDLLDLSCMSHGKLNLKMEAVDIHDVLQDAVQIMADQARAKHIELQMSLNAKRHKVYADPVRLQQIFWNVLSNAIKFTNKDGKIQVVTSAKKADNIFEVKIKDTGIGMTSGELERIFLPFSQGDHTKNSQYGGLGLGLVIAKKLVEFHSGTIRAESEGRARGTTVIIRFPLTSP